MVKCEGIDVNKTTLKGASPLLIASQNDLVDVVKELLKNKNIDVNKKHLKFKSTTALYIAAQNDRVEGITHIPNLQH